MSNLSDVSRYFGSSKGKDTRGQSEIDIYTIAHDYLERNKKSIKACLSLAKTETRNFEGYLAKGILKDSPLLFILLCKDGFLPEQEAQLDNESIVFLGVISSAEFTKSISASFTCLIIDRLNSRLETINPNKEKLSVAIPSIKTAVTFKQFDREDVIAYIEDS